MRTRRFCGALVVLALTLTADTVLGDICDSNFCFSTPNPPFDNATPNVGLTPHGQPSPDVYFTESPGRKLGTEFLNKSTFYAANQPGPPVGQDANFLSTGT